MSKIAEVLKKASEERAAVISPMGRKGNARKQWFTWIFVATVLAIFVAFNYRGAKEAVPLSEIFPEEEVLPVDVAYEFVQEEKAQTVAEPVAVKAEVAQPVVEVPAKKPAYTVQIASFKNQQRAQEALSRIKEAIPSAYLGSRDLGEKGTWYRVYAGRFDGRREAETALTTIKQSYADSFIISPGSSQ
jgi:cell division septation protein DedD